MDTYEELEKSILFNMKKHRKQRGIKQYEMAKKLGYQPGLYNKVELGHKILRLPILFAFAKELDVPFCDMFIAKDVEKRSLGEKFEKLMSLPEKEREAVERMMDMAIERHEMLHGESGRGGNG